MYALRVKLTMTFVNILPCSLDLEVYCLCLGLGLEPLVSGYTALVTSHNTDIMHMHNVVYLLSVRCQLTGKQVFLKLHQK